MPSNIEETYREEAQVFAFEILLNKQHELQVDSFGTDPLVLDPEARAEFFRWNAFALEDELHEVMAEIGWKPWATSRHVNVDAALNEMVDMLHFFGNIALAIGGAAGMTPDEIAADLGRRYTRKHEVNAQRQREGYDGVENKCPTCHRDLDEVNTVIQEANDASGTTRTKFCVCGETIETRA